MQAHDMSTNGKKLIKIDHPLSFEKHLVSAYHKILSNIDGCIVCPLVINLNLWLGLIMRMKCFILPVKS